MEAFFMKRFFLIIISLLFVGSFSDICAMKRAHEDSFCSTMQPRAKYPRLEESEKGSVQYVHGIVPSLKLMCVAKASQGIQDGLYQRADNSIDFQGKNYFFPPELMEYIKEYHKIRYGLSDGNSNVSHEIFPKPKEILLATRNKHYNCVVTTDAVHFLNIPGKNILPPCLAYPDVADQDFFPYKLILSSDSKRLYSVFNPEKNVKPGTIFFDKRTITIWNLNREGHSLVKNVKAYECILSQDDTLFCLIDDNALVLLDAQDFEHIKTVKVPHIHLKYQNTDQPPLLLLSHDKKLYAVLNNTIEIWDLETGLCTAMTENHEKEITGLCLDGNNRLYSSSLDKTVKIWDLDTKTCINTLTYKYPMIKMELFPDYGFLVTLSSIKTKNYKSLLYTFDLSTGKCVDRKLI
jgi:WD40 repeat protein